MFIVPSGSTAAQSRYWATSLSNNAPNANITFDAISVGAASADRLVIVFIAWKGTASGDITGLTCNTVAMTEVTKAYLAANSDGCAIYSLLVTANTTATLAAAFSGSVDDCRVSVYTINGWNSSTAQDSGFNINGIGTNPSTTLTHSIGSICIVGALWRGATNTCTLLIGGSAIAEDYEAGGLPDSSSTTVGSKTMSTAVSEETVLAAIDLSSVKYLVAASWR